MAKKKTVKKKEKKILLVVEISKETQSQLNFLKKEHGINKMVSVRNAINEYHNKIKI